MHVHFTRMSERVAASPGDSLFAKALMCAVSVVRVQDGAATSCVRREISVSVATNGSFWQMD